MEVVVVAEREGRAWALAVAEAKLEQLAEEQPDEVRWQEIIETVDGYMRSVLTSVEQQHGAAFALVWEAAARAAIFERLLAGGLTAEPERSTRH